MKRKALISTIMISVIVTMFASASCRKQTDSIKIRFWHSYTGAQSEMFQKIVDNYNSTVGRARGVEVIAYYKGSSEALSSELATLAVRELPNIISVKSEDAYYAYLKSKIVCAEDFLSRDVLDGYPSGILGAGRFTYSTGTYYFPISAETEILYINSGLMNEFASVNNINFDNLETWDGIYSLAKQYHAWSGGMPFVAINDVGSFIQTSAKQYMSSIVRSGGRGIDIFFNPDVLKKIWNFYHGGFVRGYIADGREDPDGLMEDGKLVCILGSVSDAWSVPLSYRDGTGEEHYLETVASKYPQVSGGDNIVPILTDGVVVLNKDKTQCQESFVFLNWLDNNREMSKVCTAGKCLPVSKNVLSDGTVLSEMDSFISAAGRNRGITSVYSEAYGLAETASLFSPAIFSGMNDFNREIAESLADASVRDRELFLQRIADGEDPECVLESLDADGLFREWLSQLEKIKTKY